MKIKLFTAGAALSLLLLSACGGGGDVSPKAIGDAGVKTTPDSISYYEGMTMVYGMYQQMSMQDTTLKSDAAKAEFLKAFAKTLQNMDGKSEAELAGMMAAMQAAMSNREMSKEFDIKLNNALISTGLAYAMQNDSVASNGDGMRYIQTTFQRLQNKKMETSRAAAAGKLGALAKQGYTKLADSMYEKVVTPGTGAALKQGEKVKVQITCKDEAGKEMKLPIQMPEEVVVGQTFAGTPLSDAIASMKVGENAIVGVAAVDMFQGRQSQLGLSDDAIMLFDVKIIEVTGDAPAAPAANIKAAATPAAGGAQPAPAKK